ncbi:MAG: hypothetical protein PHU62_04930 [Bacteroidales bacterium]|jgi:tetratricopeptide (TPR) repeat protein|nr:hypothetical protein [Bacteroidales bacterium]MDD2204671.1 hypothetical protein [Bacteroidales bacterium]MDD3151306.1 hypothetical protein [Bacteroidales bacterium]MDD3913654.1 hypothetical protein [Bacteroidales bacterium]MDD4633905.1 hypothetical protein [Bacteroidales bacterium]
MPCRLFFIPLVIAVLLSACNNIQNNSAHTETADNQQQSLSVQQLDSLIQRDSLNGKWYSLRAAKYYDNAKFIDAFYDISNALQINGDNIPDLLLLSDIYFVLGKTNEAQFALNKAENIDNQDYTVCYAKGKHYFLVGEFVLADGYLRKSIKLNPNNPQSYFVLGQMAMLQNDTTAAIADFQSATQVDNNFIPAYLQLAVVYMDLNSDLVPQYLDNVLTIDKNNSKALFLYGVYFQLKEDYEKAFPLFVSSFNSDKNNKIAAFNIGYIYLTEKLQFDSAAVWFNKAYQLDEGFNDALYNLGYCAELSGNTDSANVCYNLLRSHVPDYPLLDNE